jgi:hypothetical protein
MAELHRLNYTRGRGQERGGMKATPTRIKVMKTIARIKRLAGLPMSLSVRECRSIRSLDTALLDAVDAIAADQTASISFKNDCFDLARDVRRTLKRLGK